MSARQVSAASFAQDVVQESSTRPVLVDFWAPWCGPCRQVAPILDQLARESGGRYAVVKVNTDDEAALAAQFGIRSIPTLLLFKDGAPVAEMIGAQPKRVIVDALSAHL